jgi:hypothetical protein
VRYASRSVTVAAVFDRRGEVELRTALLDNPEPHGTLTLHGMVGQAAAPRVVELLAARLRGEEAALRGESDFYDHLAAVQREAAQALTAYYSGRGPREVAPFPLTRWGYAAAAFAGAS